MERTYMVQRKGKVWVDQFVPGPVFTAWASAWFTRVLTGGR